MPGNLEYLGFAHVPNVLSPAECDALLHLVGTPGGAGRRGLLALPEIRQLAQSPKLQALTASHLTAPAKAVRAIFFDKSADANWTVAWHQDLTLAVKDQREVPGFGPWSVKAGITHVQPPAEWLERMLTVRLHLDPADAANGALKLLPGTHRQGRLDAAAISVCRQEVPETLCVAAGGDALLMKPLLLHASGKSQSTRHRRVLHLEFADFALPGGMEWHECA